MSNVIGKIGDVEIKTYDVVEVSNDGGVEWLDYSTILTRSDVAYAERLVNGGGVFNGHYKANYRIRRSQFEILYDGLNNYYAYKILKDSEDEIYLDPSLSNVETSLQERRRFYQENPGLIDLQLGTVRAKDANTAINNIRQGKWTFHTE